MKVISWVMLCFISRSYMMLPVVAPTLFYYKNITTSAFWFGYFYYPFANFSDDMRINMVKV